MRAPHFVRLAQLDEHRFINACRHGLVHLTWGRMTLRLLRDEFRSLADLLEHVVQAQPPASVRDGELEVSVRLDGDGELRLGPFLLLLAPDELRQFAKTARQAVEHLDHFLASGAWDRDREDDTPSGVGHPLQRTPFSDN